MIKPGMNIATKVNKSRSKNILNALALNKCEKKIFYLIVIQGTVII